jgi:hypothetical protein
MKKIYAYAWMINSTGLSIEYTSLTKDNGFIYFYDNDTLIRIVVESNLLCLYVADSEIELYSQIPPC